MNSETFDPVLYSLEENEFLKSALGQPPVVALRNLPAGVNPNAVRPVLEDAYALIELERHESQEWVGLDAIREKITAYLDNATQWATDKRRGAPRFPTMHSFDSRGRPHRQGVGSDSGQIRTYFDANGQRIPFAIKWIPESTAAWTASWAKAQTPAGLKVDADNKRIECQLCGHTESFNPESRGSYNAARGRMSKHLRSATDKVEDHRELHTNEFTS